MTHTNTDDAASRGESALERGVRPGLPVVGCVWSGMVWLVSLRSPVKMDLGARLYTDADVDAAGAAERERCADRLMVKNLALMAAASLLKRIEIADDGTYGDLRETMAGIAEALKA